MNPANVTTTATNTTSAPAVVGLIGEALVDRFPTHAVVGGAPLNVARSLAAFGVPTVFVTRIGRDPTAQTLLDNMRQFGVSTAGVQVDATHPTGTVSVEMADDGASHRFLVHDNQAWDYIDAHEAVRALGLAPTAPRVLYFGTLAQRSAVSERAVHIAVETTRCLRYLDLNLRDGPNNQRIAAASLQLADWVKVNDDELRALMRWYLPAFKFTSAHDVNEATEQMAVAELMRMFSLERVIVTHGPQGYTSYSAGGVCDARGTGLAAPRLVDTVGAGDAFSAVVLAGIAYEWPLPLTLARANAFAAAVCGVPGAVSDDPAFFAYWRQTWGLFDFAPFEKTQDATKHATTKTAVRTKQ